MKKQEPMQVSQLKQPWMIRDAPCWVRNQNKGETKKIYLKGKISSGDIDNSTGENNSKLTVKIEESQLDSDVNVQQIFQRDISQEGQQFEDMVKMSTLNEAELLRNISERYFQDKIFTYIGPTLIVMNPYKSINETFSAKTVAEIKDNYQKNKSEFNLDNQPPHVFAISCLAFKNLQETRKKQAIVISGESGAGKTENAKYAMKFLTQMSEQLESHQNNPETSSIEERILSCNPLLEAFGNAKTVRNDNSSRFGKYVKILVRGRKIEGAEITKYLLEKSRVVKLAEGERNYHIFYHLLRGGNSAILQAISLENKRIEDFKYLNQSSCRDIDGMIDSELFDGILSCLKKMNFSMNREMAVFKLLSGVLYLGNIEFLDGNFDENTACTIENQQTLNTVCELLSINPSKLITALTVKTRQINGQTILSPLNKDECNNSKQALSKTIYDRLFSSLVVSLNQGIAPISQENMNQSTLQSVGLLDIFGFENFKANSFEQLCINYANEYLQQLYISYVFKNEERIFTEDGLQDRLSNLSYQDNQAVLDLFDSNSGLFALLNESCLLKTSDDMKFLSKIKEITYSSKNNNNLVLFPKFVDLTFSIVHTQSNVEYNVGGFREKNADELSSTIKDCLMDTQNSEIRDVLELEEKESVTQSLNVSSNQRNKFLSSKFKQQMSDLMNELNSSDVHFVRCIKPNVDKQAGVINEDFVMQQIKYLGVLESIEVRKNTYPVRKDFMTFFKQYKICSKNNQIENTKRVDFEELCKMLLKEIAPDATEKLVLFGKTRIYLKEQLEMRLDLLKNKETQRKYLHSILKIQHAYRRIMKKRKRTYAIKEMWSFSNQLYYHRLVQSFQRIRYTASLRVVEQLLVLLTRQWKKTLIISFYAIKEKFLMLKTLEQASISMQNSQQFQVSNQLGESQIIIPPANQSRYQADEQGVDVSQDKSVDQVLENQYDSGFSSRLSQRYGTFAVEPSGYNVENDKFFYQGSSQEEEKDNEAAIKLIDLQEYSSTMVKEWNAFETPLTDIEGETILVGRPTDNENEDSALLQKLLDTKSMEKEEPIPVQKAIDSYFQIESIENDAMEEIKGINFWGFYKKHLNKRTKMMGVRKSEKEILTYQTSPLSKGALIQVNSLEVEAALQHFLFLIHYSQNDVGKTPKSRATQISDLILFSLRKSIQFYNEILTQILKQLNGNKKEQITIKLLQYLKVFLYCFTPDDEFLNIFMHFLIFNLYKDQWKDNQNVKAYLLYNIPSIIRKIDQENPRKTIFSSLIPNYEVQALISCQQFPIPVIFSTGSSIQVNVDAWDTIHDVKEKVMRFLKINTERIKVEYMQMFELHFENNQVQERMLLPSQYAWDVLYHWNQRLIERQKKLLETNQGNQPDSSFSILMIRVFFPFTLYRNDYAGIALLFSQVFFDIYVGKQVFEEESKLIQLTALVKVINDFQDPDKTDITESLPLIIDAETKQRLLEPIVQEYNKIKGVFSLIEAKYVYLKIARESEYYLGLQIPIKYILSDSEELSELDYLLVLKPTYFFIVTEQTKKRVLLYYYQQITKWGRNVKDSVDHILIITNDGIKHLIESKYTEQIDFYFHEANSLIAQNRIKSVSSEYSSAQNTFSLQAGNRLIK